MVAELSGQKLGHMLSILKYLTYCFDSRNRTVNILCNPVDTNFVQQCSTISRIQLGRLWWFRLCLLEDLPVSIRAQRMKGQGLQINAGIFT